MKENLTTPSLGLAHGIIKLPDSRLAIFGVLSLTVRKSPTHPTSTYVMPDIAISFLDEFLQKGFRMRNSLW